MSLHRIRFRKDIPCALQRFLCIRCAFFRYSHKQLPLLPENRKISVPGSDRQVCPAPFRAALALNLALGKGGINLFGPGKGDFKFYFSDRPSALPAALPINRHNGGLFSPQIARNSSRRSYRFLSTSSFKEPVASLFGIWK